MKNKFILISMRQDYFYNGKELRFCIDTKLVDWVSSLGFRPLLVSDLNTLNFLLKQTVTKPVSINASKQILSRKVYAMNY